MRGRYKVWCVCLLAWLIGCTGTAVAEYRYDTLCREGNVYQQNTVGWIEIPGADFCQPVMQHERDDAYYANHDAAGVENQCGSLYTQASYNAADFSDPVTVIYGSSKAEGTPFRNLQETYSGRFEECSEILLHLPEETLRYEVFAAVPHSSIHILHYYDFSIQRRYNGFFDGIYSTRLLGMHLNAENRPEYGDRVLILSTGLRGEATQRYLVMAKLMAN